MRQYIYILLILLFNNGFSQDFQIQTEIPPNITPEKIIKKYINSIGGEKKINKIKTIEKKFEIKIDGVQNITMQGKVLYKNPNLYASTLEIPTLGQIQSTKYDGKNCKITRLYKDKEETNEVKGKMLEEKLRDFYAFPILEIKKNDIETKITEIHIYKDYSVYKMQVWYRENNNEKLFLFFNSETNYLTKKIIISDQTINTTYYKEYKELDGIFFPWKEINTMDVNGILAQKTTNQIQEIILNKDFSIDLFQ